MHKITNDELKILIAENSAESMHVDFKQEWHSNNAKLILDILCLSNVDYEGDRFMLLGVCDNAKILGVPLTGSNRKDSATLFDLLRGSNFNRLPEINVYTLSVETLHVDIIHIANAPYKPFFLFKDKKEQGITVRAGVVYSRNGSSNTPIDQTATETEIEKMWRERFGLDKSPAARVKKYLLDVNNWVHDQSTQFYEPFPEFTIQENFDQHHSLDANQEWSRGEIGYHYNPGNSATQMLIRYHQTCLSKIHVVVFDGQKKSIVAPSREFVGAGCFYYYLKDSVDYAYHCYLVKTGSETDHSKGLSFIHNSTRSGTYDIPVFQNKIELEKFLSTFNQPSASEPSVDEAAQNEIWYEALEKYNEWKA